MRRKGKRWRKVGGGIHRTANGRKIRKGQVFWAEEDEVPSAFRDVIEEYPEAEEVPEEEVKPKKTTRTRKKKSTTAE